MTHQPARADLGPEWEARKSRKRQVTIEGKPVVVSLGDGDPGGPMERGERITDEGLGKHRAGKRATAYWLPAQMRGKGTLSAPAYVAALKFRDDWELSQGAKDGIAAQPPGVRADGFSGACPTQTALDAMARVRAALEAVGMSGSVCLSMCVARNADLGTLAAKLGHREQAASGYFAGVLDRLADHYSGGKQRA